MDYGYGKQIEKGMTVWSADGHKLGKVVFLNPSDFIVEKGLFFKKDHVADYGSISEIRGDDAYLKLTYDELTREEPRETRTAAVTEETRLPLAEEQLEVAKREREAAQVIVDKKVVTEEKQVSVPVTHEEVTVERRPASTTTPTASEGAFRETTTTIPIHEEEVEIKKRPVVREEVRVAKEKYQEEYRAAETLKKEVPEVKQETVTKKYEEPPE